jgi:hypothetical protein
MVLTNAEKQARWRERHIGKRRDTQRIVNLLVLKHLTDDHVQDIADLLVMFLNRQRVRILRRRLQEQTETPTPEQIVVHNRKTLGDDFSEEAWERRQARGRARNEAEKVAWERDHPGQRFPEHGCNLTPREATDLARWRRQRAKANKLKRAEARLARWRRRQPKEMKRAQAYDRAY